MIARVLMHTGQFEVIGKRIGGHKAYGLRLSSPHLPVPQNRYCLFRQFAKDNKKARPASSRTGPERRAGRLAAAVRVRDYFAFANATAVSSMRFEKPHSLSYQLDTLTRRPDTLVSVASNVDEAGLWLKSIDTSGASL